MTPQDAVAQHFIARKGYPDLAPRDVMKLDGQQCWYYVYDLPDGFVVEIEVAWDGEEWHTLVTTFNEADEVPPGVYPRGTSR